MVCSPPRPRPEAAAQALREVSIISDLEAEGLDNVGSANSTLAQWSGKLLAGALASNKSSSQQRCMFPSSPGEPSSSFSSTASAAPVPSRETKLVRSYNGGMDFLVSAASRSWKKDSWGLGVFAGAIPSCFAREATRQCHIRGTVVIRGSVSVAADALRDAVRQALQEVLVPAAGPVVDVIVEPARAQQESKGEEPNTWEFDFGVALSDANDAEPAAEVLRLETESAGARSLLPALADLLVQAGRLAVRLEATTLPFGRH